jgi:hypothetical protein
MPSDYHSDCQTDRALAVNVERVAEVRRRPGERDWELRLEPPVNRILRVARGRAATLWAAYGENGSSGAARRR